NLIAHVLIGDRWKHAPDEDEDGGTGYERDSVRLELTFLVRNEEGEVFIPLRSGPGKWPPGTFGNDVAELHGVRAQVIAPGTLLRGKSQRRTDPEDAAKDEADVRALTEAQVERLVVGIQDVAGEILVGAYLHGSAVLGGLRPRSDIDVIAVITRRTASDEQRALVDLLLTVSRRPRPIEFELVVDSEIRPWRYPPRCDFHYSELWRDEFESSKLEPWTRRTTRDLTSGTPRTLVGNKRPVGTTRPEA